MPVANRDNLLIFSPFLDKFIFLFCDKTVHIINVLGGDWALIGGIVWQSQGGLYRN